jgi:siroheme synthase-like protein
MSTLALNIAMRGKRVVVIGGGSVALRKIRTLLAVDAAVTVIAMTITAEIAALHDENLISVRIGPYRADDLDGAFLVIAATDDAGVNRQICEDAKRSGILTSVTDNPSAGDCTFPATLHRGDLEIAVSTGGRCPTFAADVRDRIADCIGSEYGAILEQLAAEREKLLTNGSSSTYNTQVLRSLAQHLLAEFTESKGSLP